MSKPRLMSQIQKPEYVPPPEDSTPLRVKVRGFSDEIFESAEQLCDCFQITPEQLRDALDVGSQGLLFITPIGHFVFTRCQYGNTRNPYGRRFRQKNLEFDFKR